MGRFPPASHPPLPGSARSTGSSSHAHASPASSSLSDGSRLPVWLLASLLLFACFSLYTLHSYAALMRLDEQTSARADSPVPSITAARLRLMQMLHNNGEGEGGGGGGGGVRHAPTRPPLLPPAGLHEDHGAGEGDSHGVVVAGGLPLLRGSSHQRLRLDLARKMRIQPRTIMETNPIFAQQIEEQKQKHQKRHHPKAPGSLDSPSKHGGAVATVADGRGASVVASPSSSSSSSTDPIPILLFTFNRPENLRSTLQSVLSHRPADTSLHPIYISQDGADEATRRVAMEFVDNIRGDSRGRHVFYMHFRWEAQRVAVEPHHAKWTTYYKIATHYRWALGQLFDHMAAGTADTQPKLTAPVRYSHAILLEDDMLLAPDFFSYFRRTRTLLDADPTLMCVSAWNDNGRAALAHDPRQLHRSECFPGLGWMLARRLWEELGPRWPKGFWDDWLRESPQRAGRSCIFPERNRVFTFGSAGSSAGQFYDQYLRTIVLNDQPVEWQREGLEYIDSKEHYRAWMHGHIRSATRLPAAAAVATPMHLSGRAAGDYVLEYANVPALDVILHSLNMMTDHKDGVARTSFEGVLSAHLPQGQRLWIVPTHSPFMQATLPASS